MALGGTSMMALGLPSRSGGYQSLLQLRLRLLGPRSLDSLPDDILFPGKDKNRVARVTNQVAG